jgi:hypothetical protein
LATAFEIRVRLWENNRSITAFKISGDMLCKKTSCFLRRDLNRGSGEAG